MSQSPHRDGLLSCIMNTPIRSKGDSNNIQLIAKVIPFQRSSCSISNGSKIPPLTHLFTACVCRLCCCWCHLQLERGWWQQCICRLVCDLTVSSDGGIAACGHCALYPAAPCHRVPLAEQHRHCCSVPAPLHIISGLHCTVQPASKLVLTTVAMSHHSTLNRDVQKCDLAPRVNPNNKA